MGKHLAPPKNKHLKPSKPKEFKMPDIKGIITSVFSEKLSVSVSKPNDEKETERSFSKRELITVSVSVLLLAAIKLAHIGGIVGKLLCIIPFAAAGYEVLLTALEQAINLRLLRKEFLIAVSCIFSAISGQIFGAASIMVLWRLCEVLMLYEKEKCGKKIAVGTADADGQVKLINSAGFEMVDIDSVSAGDIVEFDKGAPICFDCCVTSGMSSVDISALTGESDSCPIAEGSIISSGCVNLTSTIQCRVLNTAKNSTAARFTAAVENSGAYASKQEKIISDISQRTVPYFAAAAVLMTVLMPILGAGWRRGFAAASVLLAVSSLEPLCNVIHCCYQFCIRKACAEGIMIKGHTDLETLSKAETMVFGKTKVVTEGRYEILEAFPNGMPEEQMLSYAAAAELNSSHPIARAIVGAGRRDVSERFAVIEMDEIPGRGVSAFVDGKHVYVGNAELLKDHGIDYLIPSRPGSAIHVAVDNHYAGHILVYDKIKDGAFEAVDELRVNGVKTSVMLTGDVRSTARSVALTLNFDMVKPELSPDAKASAVEYLMATRNINTTLAYVGDGISDIKALNRASVGITVGVFDAPEALDNADIAIMGRDLRKLAGLYRLAKLSYRVCRIDTLVMCIAKAAVLCLGAAGILTVGWAVMLSTAATLAALVYSFSPELFR